MSRNNNPSNSSSIVSSSTSNPPKNNSTYPAPYSGLYLFGQIIDRTRRHVPKDNPTTEIVTYTVQTERDSKFFVDDYAPDSYYYLGSAVCFPVLYQDLQAA